MNQRPEIKVNDKVRFRTGGEIGMIIALEMKYRGLLNKPMIVIKADKKYCHVSDYPQMKHHIETLPSILLDICNEFTNIQVGDEVEIFNMRYDSQYEKTDIHTVKKVTDTHFMFALPCFGGNEQLRQYNLSDGKTDDPSIFALRITKTAQPKERPCYIVCDKCGGSGVMPNPKVKEKPTFEKGQFGRDKDHANEVFFIVDNVPDDDGLIVVAPVDNVDLRWQKLPRNIIPVPASEVVVDFGCFQGTIVAEVLDRTIMVIPENYRPGTIDPISIIALSMLAKPIYSVVLILLERQEKEKRNKR
jgi:hypothetical protein